MGNFIALLTTEYILRTPSVAVVIPRSAPELETTARFYEHAVQS
jgi:hypothetical protein